MLNRDLHQVELTGLLKAIYSNNVLGPLLGFKGGTALALIHDLNRFSVDLDFDLLKPEQEELVFDELLKIAKEHGEIKENKIRKHSIIISFSYKQELQNLKIEVSTRVFGSRYELQNWMGISMLVMVPEDIFANKLVALTDRAKATNRDLYDVHWLLTQHWDINEDIIQTRTNKGLKAYIDNCIKHIEAVDRKQILSGLGDLVTDKQKDWIKHKLIDDLLFQIKVRFNKKN